LAPGVECAPGTNSLFRLRERERRNWLLYSLFKLAIVIDSLIFLIRQCAWCFRILGTVKEACMLAHRMARCVAWLACVALLSAGAALAFERTAGRDRIERGEDLFLRDWSSGDALSPKGDGLGPMFNDQSCAGCHKQGGVGGGGAKIRNVQLLTFVGTTPTPTESFGDPFGAAANGVQKSAGAKLREIHPGFAASQSQVQTIVLHRQSTDRRYDAWRLKLLGHEPFVLDTDVAEDPAQPISFARLDTVASDGMGKKHVKTLVIDGLQLRLSERNTPALFGARLIDNISERVLRQVALEQSRKHPGISGRVPRSIDGKVGRFGWRGQVATLRDFIHNACATELGLALQNREQAVSPLPETLQFSPVELKKPEQRIDLDSTQVGELEAFVHSLRRPVQSKRKTDELELLVGETVFEKVGCAACHQERIARINGIYSDLLLHDMGAELSDPAPAVSPNQRFSFGSGYGGGSISIASTADISELQREWRTPPLWGVRDSAPYLHDGRAGTLEEAIAWHGGEAEESVEKFNDLLVTDRASLVAFLNTLVAP
jgi:CxxC motif-containing protein (DUF1111 family)